MDLPRHLCALIATPLVLAIASSASATEITANAYATINGTNTTLQPNLAGTVVYSDTVGYYTDLGVVEPKTPDDIENGYVKSWIVQEAGTGYLDFYYQPVVISTGASGVEAISVGGLPIAPSIDANFLSDAAPLSQGATVDYETLEPTGNLFSQTGPLAIFIHTSQTTFNPAPTGTVTVSFDHILTAAGAENLPVVVPGESSSTPAVPEPASLALLPLAITALGLRFRRSRNTLS